MGNTAIVGLVVLERILGRGTGKEEFLCVGNGTGLFALSSKTSLKTYIRWQCCRVWVWVYFGGHTMLRLAYRQPSFIQVIDVKILP